MARPPKPNLTAIAGGRGGGSGPEDPMLDQRVAALELDMKEVKASLRVIELAVTDIKHLPRMSDYASLQKDFGALKADMARIEGRISNMPTTWQLLTFTIGAVLGAAGLAFTFARFLKP